jgi:hypothetical protein
MLGGMQLTSALFLRAAEETKISLIWSTATMPEKKPLHELVLFEIILESKMKVCVKLQ